ncbi:MAG: hypothetical protein B6D61_10945 [Bacteroidetes bacterium 4484_249]|nr:MAG: hypothetical protein B6D61_10945 [Bacteroidetes bacterium 4484_249]
MKILLDECLDRRIATELIGHKVITVPKRGWAGIKNGNLLKLAEKEFDVFITVDRNLTFQQNYKKINLLIIILADHGTRAKDLQPIIPEILASLKFAKKGNTILIGKKI